VEKRVQMAIEGAQSHKPDPFCSSVPIAFYY